MENTIYLKDVLKQMRQEDANGDAVPFSLAWRTYNRQNKMGGKLKSVPYAVLCFKLKKDKVTNWEAVLKNPSLEKARKKPNHHTNYTINIEEPGKRPTKVNVLLITKFNQLDVVY